MLTDFDTWLNGEVETRGWNYSELARRAGVSPSTVSMVLNGQTRITPDFCISVAHALRERPEVVLRKAGILPPLPAPVDEEEEALGIFRQLPATLRDIALAILRTLATRQAPAFWPVKEPPQPYGYQDDPLVVELVEAFRRLPREWRDVAVQEVERVEQFASLPRIRIIGGEEEDNGQ